MTAPVLFARRNPLLAATTLAVGALVNWGLIGYMVRCGAALPAVFFVAFTIGLRCRRRPAVVAMALLAVNLVSQGYSDPNFANVKGAIVVLMLPISIGFRMLGPRPAPRLMLALPACSARSIPLPAMPRPRRSGPTSWGDGSQGRHGDVGLDGHVWPTGTFANSGSLALGLFTPVCLSDVL